MLVCIGVRVAAMSSAVAHSPYPIVKRGSACLSTPAPDTRVSSPTATKCGGAAALFSRRHASML
eukprot:363984-Chlamydomonas_euryale.AAC.27